MNSEATPSTSAICTLFEGDYHFGLAALVNSLCRVGYRGDIWVGHRGGLPFWAFPVKHSENGATVFSPTSGIKIKFVALGTSAHLTNYKPDFMLQLLQSAAKNCEALFYFDPDIIVNENWGYFMEWVSCGVAVCEDVNSPLAICHPRRIGWQRFFQKHSIQLQPREVFYANAGFVGVSRRDIQFLETWKRLQDLMWQEFGGAQYAGISGGKSIQGKSGFADCFRQPDQDALNAAFEAHGDLTVSFLNKQAMGFEPGRAVLPHALGAAKPWRKKFLWSALQGQPPTKADRQFWLNTATPIRLFGPIHLGIIRFSVAVAGFIGRFYRRS